MFKYHLKASVSRIALAYLMRLTERSQAAKNAVLHADGTPVLTCDLKILHPFRIEQRGVARYLIPV